MSYGSGVMELPQGVSVQPYSAEQWLCVVRDQGCIIQDLGNDMSKFECEMHLSTCDLQASHKFVTPVRPPATGASGARAYYPPAGRPIAQVFEELRLAGDWDQMNTIAGRVVGDMLLTLRTLKKRNLVHGAVGPWSILYGSDGRCRLTDFSCARLVGSSEPINHPLLYHWDYAYHEACCYYQGLSPNYASVNTANLDLRGLAFTVMFLYAGHLGGGLTYGAVEDACVRAADMVQRDWFAAAQDFMRGAPQWLIDFVKCAMAPPGFVMELHHLMALPGIKEAVWDAMAARKAGKAAWAAHLQSARVAADATEAVLAACEARFAPMMQQKMMMQETGGAPILPGGGGGLHNVPTSLRALLWRLEGEHAAAVFDGRAGKLCGFDASHSTCELGGEASSEELTEDGGRNSSSSSSSSSSRSSSSSSSAGGQEDRSWYQPDDEFTTHVMVTLPTCLRWRAPNGANSKDGGGGDGRDSNDKDGSSDKRVGKKEGKGGMRSSSSSEGGDGGAIGDNRDARSSTSNDSDSNQSGDVGCRRSSGCSEAAGSNEAGGADDSSGNDVGGRGGNEDADTASAVPQQQEVVAVEPPALTQHLAAATGMQLSEAGQQVAQEHQQEQQQQEQQQEQEQQAQQHEQESSLTSAGAWWPATTRGRWGIAAVAATAVVVTGAVICLRRR